MDADERTRPTSKQDIPRSIPTVEVPDRKEVHPAHVARGVHHQSSGRPPCDHQYDFTK